MPQITITLSDQLYEELAAAVEGSKLTAEDFILLAIAEKNVTPSELHPDAAASYAEYLRTGLSVPMEEVFDYFEARLAGKDVPKPVLRKMRG